MHSVPGSSAQQNFQSQKGEINSFPILSPLLSKIVPLTCGIMLLSEAGEIVHANEQSIKFLTQMNRIEANIGLIPDEIQYLHKSLMESKALFPEQSWFVEAKFFIDQLTAFHVRIQWMTPEKVNQSLLLLTIEDEYKLIKNFFYEEAQKYQLTPREKEIWLLYRTNYTYKDIAKKLGITPNTVKKHMKSILLKQRNNG